jgi:hypothetical protein
VREEDRGQLQELGSGVRGLVALRWGWELLRQPPH